MAITARAIVVIIFCTLVMVLGIVNLLKKDGKQTHSDDNGSKDSSAQKEDSENS